MTNSIPYYIREQLREDREVYLPGLGVFSLKQHSAAISEDKLHISAPTLSLHYLENNGDESGLLQKISRVEQISLEKAKKKLTKYTDKIFNNLLNLNTVQLDGIGTLVRQPDEQIVFKDTVTQLTDEFNGLKALSLKPIKRMSAPSTNENSNYQLPISENQEPKRRWWIPLLGGLLIFAVYLFSTKACNTGNEGGLLGDTDDNKEQLDTKEELAAADDEVDIKTEVADKTDVLEEMTAEQGVDVDGTKTTEKVEEVTTEAVEDIVEEVTPTKEESEPAAKVEIIKQEDLATDKGTVVDVQEIDYNTTLTDASGSVIKSVNYDGATCIIIVGSFKKAKNVLRMMQKVEQMGYQAYSAPFHDFTRVGLKFQCKASDLNKYIAEVRSKLEKGAWYLESPSK